MPLADCFPLVIVSLSLSTISAGLCPDWEAWDPNQPVQNAREAMQQADDWLGVPQVHSRSGSGKSIGTGGPRGEAGCIRTPGQRVGERQVAR